MIHQRAVPSEQGGGVSSTTAAAALDTAALQKRRTTKRKKRIVKSAFRSHYDIPAPALILSIIGGIVLAGCAGLVFFRVGRFVLEDLFGSNNQNGNNRNGDDTVSSRGVAEHKVLPFNPIYRIPGSMSTVGDRSNEYVKLRKLVDPLLPPDTDRWLERVAELNTADYLPMDMDGRNSDQVADWTVYDIYNCPDTPPPGYPYQWNLVRILENWPVNDVVPPSHIHQGLCVFDYDKDYDKAIAYREAELPFVVANDPEVAQVVERWNTPGYMERLLGNVQHRCEYSENNHFMYYVPLPKSRNHRRTKRNRGPRVQAPEGWTPPTKNMRMTYQEWLSKANVTDDKLGPGQAHWYFRLIGCGYMGSDGSCDQGSSEYLFDELTFFQPKEGLYVVEPEEQKGIHCRFGMKGVIAENHFDTSRNAIVVLSGKRRYILSHPNQCENLALYPKEHPSARHSAVDWSDPDLEEYPQFANAMSNEVIMQPGQVLYLPTNWFHFIVSLDLNMQCNTRSGMTDDYDMAWCGF